MPKRWVEATQEEQLFVLQEALMAFEFGNETM